MYYPDYNYGRYHRFFGLDRLTAEEDTFTPPHKRKNKVIPGTRLNKATSKEEKKARRESEKKFYNKFK